MVNSVGAFIGRNIWSDGKQISAAGLETIPAAS